MIDMELNASQKQAIENAKRRKAISMGGSFISGAAEGASFGFQDEIAATIGSLLALPVSQARGVLNDNYDAKSLGELYDKNFARTRQITKDAEMANPEGFIAGDIVGSVAIPGGTAIKSGAKGIQLAKTGGRLGFGSGVLNATGRSEAELGSQELLSDALQGGGFGTAMGAVAGPLFQQIGKVGNKAVDSVRGKRAERASKKATDKMDDIALELDLGRNVGVDDIKGAQSATADDVSKYFKQGVQKGLPEDSARAAAIAKREGIPLSRGDVTQNARIQADEELARIGRLGSDIEAEATQFVQQKTATLRDFGRRTIKQITGLDPADIDTSAVGARVGRNVKAVADKEQKAVNRLYNVNGRAYTPLDELNKIPDQLRKTLARENIPIDQLDVPKRAMQDIVNQIESLKQIGAKGAHVRVYNNMTERLNNFNATGKDKYAIGVMKRSVEDHRDDMINRGLISGDKSVIESLRKAPTAYAKYKQRFWGKNSKASLGRIVDNNLDDSDVVSLFVNAGNSVSKKGAAGSLRALKETVGENSEAWNQLRALHISRIMKTNLGDDAANLTPDFKKRFLDGVLYQNRQLANVLYTEAEQKAIRDVAEVAFLATNKVKSPVFTSGTPQGVLGMLDNLVQRIPSIGPGLSRIGKGTVGVFDDAAKSRSVKMGLENPLPDRISIEPSNYVSDALKAVGIGGSGLISGRGSASEASADVSSNVGDTQIQIDELIKELEMRKQRSKEDSILEKIKKIESGGNPNAKASTSSASGLYQFTNGTWRDMVGKYGKDYGITVQDKNDPDAQEIMARKLLQENRRGLQSIIGREPNEQELYLAHFFGIGNIQRLYQAGPNAVAATLLPVAAEANRSIFFAGARPRTVGEVVQVLASKVQ